MKYLVILSIFLFLTDFEYVLSISALVNSSHNFDLDSLQTAGKDKRAVRAKAAKIDLCLAFIVSFKIGGCGRVLTFDSASFHSAGPPKRGEERGHEERGQVYRACCPNLFPAGYD